MEAKKKRIDSSVVSCKICKGFGSPPFSKRLPLMPLDGVEDFEIPVEVPERARISLTSSIFAYPGPCKIFGETGAYTDRTCCQPHIREPRCTIVIGDDRRRYARVCAREKTRALPSFPDAHVPSLFLRFAGISGTIFQSDSRPLNV